MYFFEKPEVIQAKTVFRLPDRFRSKTRTSWSDPNRLGAPVDSFLEGPSFDRVGNLYFVDIPFGRIFRWTPGGDCELVCEYDGWPNGLKIHKDGRLFVCDYKKGLLVIDPKNGALDVLIGSRNSEAFKGLNDLIFASNGDCYFTDQGQTGMHDPSGRVYRLAGDRLDCLMDNIPSPNGIVLNVAENRIFVAVTRQNAVWRAPMMTDGSVSKVGTFIQLSGGHAGPDGMAMDAHGGLYVCHVSLGVWRFDDHGIPTHFIKSAEGHHITNIAFGGPDNRTVYLTEADTGTIQIANMPFPGKTMYSHM